MSWNPQANKILLEALEFEDLEARRQFVDRQCAGNSELRAAVDELLVAHAKAGQFLKSEVGETSATSVPDPQAPLFAAGTTLAGRYVVRNELGQGGMGVVLLADQTRPVRRRVAIKLIKSGLDVRSVALRFDQERNALALMEHPNIAKILDAGVVDLATGAELLADPKTGDDFRRGVPFFAMEYIEGIPITDYCDRHRLSPAARLKLFIPVCQAVQHAHQKGIIHRDLKPSNILVETVDDQPLAKVIDFGVAKATGDALTEQSLHTSLGSIVGTLEYMSPEQARLSQDIDTRTDVYALGVVLYELLSGTVPHSRDDLQAAGLAEMLRIIKEVDPLAPSSKLSNSGSLPSIASERDVVPSRLIRLVRGDLDWIVLKALDKDRNRRYDSVAGFAEDIQRYLDEEPVYARPPSAIYRLQKAYRRHRAAFVAAGLAMLLLLLGILGTSTGFVLASRSARLAGQEAIRASAAEQRAREALDEAEQQRDKADTQKDIAEAVTNFLLTDLLQQANVSLQADRILELKEISPVNHELKRNPTLLDLVDRAAVQLAPGRIDDKFPGQREVQAALLRQLGFVYNSIGQFEKAIPLLRRALEISDAELGSAHQETLAAIKYLAGALQGAERSEEAIELSDELLRRTRRAYGDRDERTLLAMIRVANGYATIENSEKAIALAQQVVEMSNQEIKLVYTESQADFKSMAEFMLASKYLQAKQREKAIPMMERTYEYRTTRLGSDHPKTINAGTWLASAYHGELRLDKAQPLYEALVPRVQELYGIDHPKTLSSIESLAACYHRLGQPQRAVEMYEELLQRRIRRQGPQAINTLRTTANLAVNQIEAGKLDEAVDNLTFVYEHGNAQPALFWTVEPYVRVLEMIGKPTEAERVCREQLETMRRDFSDQPDRIRMALFNLALNQMFQKKYADAEPLLRELVELNHQRARDHWNSFNAKSLLGSVLLEQDRLDEAEPLLLEGFAGMKQRQAKIPVNVKHHLRDGATWLVQLYEARDNPIEVKRWQNELDALPEPSHVERRSLAHQASSDR